LAQCGRQGADSVPQEPVPRKRWAFFTRCLLQCLNTRLPTTSHPKRCARFWACGSWWPGLRTRTAWPGGTISRSPRTLAFLLERVFPMAPSLAARGLALAAALARHRAACPNSALHLYRLDADNRDRLALRFAPLLPIPVPGEPITTVDGLRQHLVTLTREPVVYTVVRRNRHGLQIKALPCPASLCPLAHRARTLAWAYLKVQEFKAVLLRVALDSAFDVRCMDLKSGALG
jgi:hypothetical protein